MLLWSPSTSVWCSKFLPANLPKSSCLSHEPVIVFTEIQDEVPPQPPFSTRGSPCLGFGGRGQSWSHTSCLPPATSALLAPASICFPQCLSPPCTPPLPALHSIYCLPLTISCSSSPILARDMEHMVAPALAWPCASNTSGSNCGNPGLELPPLQPLVHGLARAVATVPQFGLGLEQVPLLRDL